MVAVVDCLVALGDEKKSAVVSVVKKFIAVALHPLYRLLTTAIKLAPTLLKLLVRLTSVSTKATQDLFEAVDFTSKSLFQFYARKNDATRDLLIRFMLNFIIFGGSSTRKQILSDHKDFRTNLCQKLEFDSPEVRTPPIH